MGGVEFLDAEPAPEGGPHDPPPRRWRRSHVLAGLIAFIALLAVIVALGLHRNGSPSAAPTTSHRTTPIASPSPEPSSTQPPLDLVTSGLTLGPGPVQAIAPDGGSVLVLQPGRLSRVAIDVHSSLNDERDMPAPVGDEGLGPWYLVRQGARTVWIVAAGINQAYTTSTAPTAPPTPTPTPTPIQIPVPITGAVALDGSVYIAGQDGVYEIKPHAHDAQRVSDLVVDSLVADPARHRLLMLTDGYEQGPTTVRAYVPGRGASDPVRLPFGRGGEVAIVGSAIWVLGYTANHGVLTRLDARTLRPSPARSVGEASLVGSGASVFWLRTATEVVCMSADGAPLQRWSGHATVVVSHAGEAYVAQGNHVGLLVLGGACHG